ncbi:Carbohydrate esterase family 16 protein [Mycena venus]|uniref:Carbohydrate esterase family 16 protein n=1 Tax=Mycena venus TaxID=2733690 RepID=A0A8H6WRG1_9AGAR|nr:Carbohydrate esterase family 16 protein [Mycena venus]
MNSGDSYTQTGFNITTGPLPSPGNPMGNPTYPGATATPGENWIDVATTKYNHSLVLTYARFQKGSISFIRLTFAGITLDIAVQRSRATSFHLFADFVRTLPDQIDELVSWNMAQHPQPWTSSNALFSIWVR